MSNANFHFYTLFLFSLFFSIKSDELEILLNLKSSLQNSNPDFFASWNSADSACSFNGITCDSNVSVVEIDLSNKNLAGSLPLDSICQLESLGKLSMGYNSLNGTVSEGLNNCVKLEYLDLGNNEFTGAFPGISSLTQLQYLYLNASGFSGAFPWNSLGKLTNLVHLSVGDNGFDPNPFPEEILKLRKLKLLYLADSGIEGKIPPGIGGLIELEDLELSNNNLSGEIPSAIGNLRNLWQLELFNNSLSGKLPTGLGNITGLQRFDASMNFLEGDLSELKTLTNLTSLQLFMNQFSGEIPTEFGEFKKLVNISLYTNQLTGPLPQKLGSWAEFDLIDVSENFLTGPIPPDMCKKGKMRWLLLLQNRFTGEIPENYANCDSLMRFRISKNSISGSVPAGIWGLPKLEIIDIEINQIEGGIAPDIENAKALGQLIAGHNRLSGGLPEEISKVASLVSIELNNNQLSGEIPGTIGELKQLSSLKLENNKISGSIPASLGACVSLSEVNMAENSISGKIPSSLGSLPTLNSLNLSGNELSGEIPESFSSLRLSLLDLSNNKLTGRIPSSLSIEVYNGSFVGNPGLCSTTDNSFQQCRPESDMSKGVRALIACSVIGSMILFIALGCFSYLRNKREKNHQDSMKKESWDVKSFHVLAFREEEILDSIKEDNLIGQGGSGNVYRVLLKNGLELAVKHIWNTDLGSRKMFRAASPITGKRNKKSSKEFDSEVQTLSSIRHVNVVKLYCSITSEDSSLLVYEYMPNGSLWDRLHTCKKLDLDWETRCEIALGAAKGLEYLHHGCERPVIHRDVKSSNILLDEFLKPRIADFGLAKIVLASSSMDSSHTVAGTHGYIAPEYGYTCKVNEKSDVYSFGVVLMELVTGKKPIEPEYGESKDIVYWICSQIKTRETILSMVDSKIPSVYKEDAIKVLRIAIMCTARLPELRPTMRSVVQMLEEAQPCNVVGSFIGKDFNDKERIKSDK